MRLATVAVEGRPIRHLATNSIMHIDAAHVGLGGTLALNGNPGDPGTWQAQCIWQWRDRAECISARELKATRMLLVGQLGERVKREGISMLRLCIDNTSVVHVTNAFVASSRPMMRELRRLKVVLDPLGLQLASEWISSVANKFADGLSWRLSPGNLAVKDTLRQSVVDGMLVPCDVFPIRPLGEHPVFLRRQCHAELSSAGRATDENRLVCPLTDLLAAVVRKWRLTRAPALLLMPDWPRQSWHQAALDLSTKMHRLPLPPADAWTGTRRLNSAWCLLMLEINLP
jgi:hypothetical protein